jgi:hypothetical protein
MGRDATPLASGKTGASPVLATILSPPETIRNQNSDLSKTKTARVARNCMERRTLETFPQKHVRSSVARIGVGAAPESRKGLMTS